ncbi:histidine phosphatase family protein [Mycobacterium paraseoulense]|uniref:Histidine phosphatase family protein n=1 Tax=Mycobacterium paraseoulense TaxID=590652 RepID=A0A1X0I638_9MYCO|nr:histidine phosphatase family protein [Mycobacterium paraseoulense]MCV7395857.1 histidine phosphatase family protein [Mycobacterium paraseoulense]ORB35025.1 histidine phosphatase family protein [Mycobacterium paraseoulense]BBZ72254.1 phosphoglycerate mutase [Mycobacterium paraseoulense]
MTRVVRLTLVSHAMTDAVAAARFPGDEPLNDMGRRQAEAFSGETCLGAKRFTAPERRAQQTAELLGLDATVDPLLADLNCGRWRGKRLRDVPPGDVTAWLADPTRAPHGGESITELIQRVARWLDLLAESAVPAVAVTHPAVTRAAIVHALGAPRKSFWRIDVAPMSHTGLHLRDGRWSLRL